MVSNIDAVRMISVRLAALLCRSLRRRLPLLLSLVDEDDDEEEDVESVELLVVDDDESEVPFLFNPKTQLAFSAPQVLLLTLVLLFLLLLLVLRRPRSLPTHFSRSRTTTFDSEPLSTMVDVVSALHNQPLPSGPGTKRMLTNPGGTPRSFFYLVHSLNTGSSSSSS